MPVLYSRMVQTSQLLEEYGLFQLEVYAILLILLFGHDTFQTLMVDGLGHIQSFLHLLLQFYALFLSCFFNALLVLGQNLVTLSLPSSVQVLQLCFLFGVQLVSQSYKFGLILVFDSVLLALDGASGNSC